MAKKRRWIMGREITSDNAIQTYFHCNQCVVEKPANQSPKEWQRIQVGFTELGLQVWCVRHEANIVHIDFEGMCHPANTARKVKAE